MIEEIKLSSECITLNKGDYLFLENGALQSVYLIDDGEITLLRTSNNSKIKVMNQVEGDIVGVDILFKGGKCGYSAKAKKTSRLYKASFTQFQQILNHQQATSFELIKYLCSLINEVEKREKQLS